MSDEVLRAFNHPSVKVLYGASYVTPSDLRPRNIACRPDPARKLEDAIWLAGSDADAVIALRQACLPTHEGVPTREQLACRTAAALIRMKENEDD